LDDSDEGGPSTEGDGTRRQEGGEAATTRFGMEDGDNANVPVSGSDPEQQSTDGAAERAGASTALQPSGTAPGGGPGATVGSIGTGGGSTGNEATGNARRGGR
jgi:hypothetical protein